LYSAVSVTMRASLSMQMSKMKPTSEPLSLAGEAGEANHADAVDHAVLNILEELHHLGALEEIAAADLSLIILHRHVAKGLARGGASARTDVHWSSCQTDWECSSAAPGRCVSALQVPGGGGGERT